MTPPTDVAHEVSNQPAVERVEQGRALPVVAWTSVGFAILQSLCTTAIGLSGLRLVISMLSLASASSVLTHARWFHQAAFRRPMLLFALVGAVVNLILVAQARRLRNRPSARWRLDVAAVAGKVRRERWLIGMSLLALVLVIQEEWLHIVQHHRW
ncbi:MAG: hypothetical protein JWM43_2186 [Acidobacteriaceae bacterium]|jgi:hypothetical protein|nr:hypothetical protein [Acidobacteriaceae bacterium]